MSNAEFTTAWHTEHMSEAERRLAAERAGIMVARVTRVFRRDRGGAGPAGHARRPRPASRPGQRPSG